VIDVSTEIDRLIRERPGRDFLPVPYDDVARPMAPDVYGSAGITRSYMVVSPGGRTIVNTGTGAEAVHHRRLFDAVCAGPTPFIVTTQSHTDHIGGVAGFRAPETRYVAQRQFLESRLRDERFAPLRRRFGAPWFDAARAQAASLAGLATSDPTATNPRPDLGPLQDRPSPDITFDERLSLRVGDLDLELFATPGGETVDSCVVWLPERSTCIVSNLFGPLFPHFPNFNTLRGDRYRHPEAYLDSLGTVRVLRPEVLLTGRGEPIVGEELIHAVLGRLHDAVEWVFRTTVDGINAGVELDELIRRVVLPDSLRVGEGYGRVSWAVRAIWESNLGWFQQRSTTELYPLPSGAADAELVRLAGPDAVAERARQVLDTDPVLTIRLGEAVLAAAPDHRCATELLLDAHRALLTDGRHENFWLDGWIRHQCAVLEGRLAEITTAPD
jgi:glyoxylase-like metal-dependent hydrolase (beta-lactamase superfamily II)